MSFTSTGNGATPSGNRFFSSLPAGGNALDMGSLASAAAMLGNVPGAGLIGGAARAAELAQTGMSLLGRTPASIADALNSAAGARSRLTQDSRFIRMESPLGRDVLLVNAMVVDEYVNRLPEIHLDLLSHQGDIQIDQIVGQPVSIRLEPKASGSALSQLMAGPDIGKRTFHGYAASFGRVGHPGAVTRYEMTVVPWFWFLTRSTDCRIFQNRTAEQILSEIFVELGFHDFEFHLKTPPATLEYVVMYRESYYNFCARLMEQEGMLWTFRYEADKHVLVIGDTNDTFRPLAPVDSIPYYGSSAASERNGIDRWDEAFSFRVGKITYRDFNYSTPSSPLMHVEVPTTLKNPNIGSTERYEYHSMYDLADDGRRYARYAMEAEEAQAHRFEGAGFVQAMTTAGRFRLTHHPMAAYDDKQFVILHVRHHAVNDYTGQAAELPYRNAFTCLPLDVPFRPERRTPKPFMYGTQAALVVGPKGEEIYTDGSRVKVHFFWDRRGKLDGSDSIWVRVSQPWAGAGWGGAAIPRIGQEVIVAFNEGDPDNPVIVGRVFNGEAANPYHGDNGQTMGIRSQTHKGGGSNELRFSDVNGAQEVYLHAQKDMNTVVQDAQSTQVLKGDRTILVSTGNHATEVSTGNMSEAIQGDRTTLVAKGNHETTVSTGDMSETVSLGDRTITVAKGNQATTVSVGNLTTTVTQGDTTQKTPAGVHTIEAKELWIRVGGSGGTSIHMTADAIELHKGSSTIRLDGGEIKIQAPNTHINPDNG
ncbi:type VI secretion system tip protein VgrG (plasmid) [Ralstonia solanacearum]|uniref:Putative vgr-related protein n=2 Tax=Ralstonia solanacearum species complex TaxID=3116862 RepID=A0A0S4V944_RALSL|nr:type VI secretion system tip protein TssI/VgrG [Ralstonia pseudosolanacearum]APC66725.1 type VI secretion system tip protein VgrG [Ralstonia solanacearum OE1-1]NKA10997.1 type VI secretion system tip protein VgrG [Ralstonia solanacearum]API77646.1 type VI secretion protein [Ralstonia pseudosolanacearum]ASL76332.1 type VI secretion protein [Ralstonia pseudosolanacearum]MCK4119888.1 type VI secretion system tip protein VgrG [Ralstonia pseudosolanacearum]